MAILHDFLNAVWNFVKFIWSAIIVAGIVVLAVAIVLPAGQQQTILNNLQSVAGQISWLLPAFIALVIITPFAALLSYITREKPVQPLVRSYPPVPPGYSATPPSQTTSPQFPVGNQWRGNP